MLTKEKKNEPLHCVSSASSTTTNNDEVDSSSDATMNNNNKNNAFAASPSSSNFFYFDNEAARQLHLFQYRGQDLSLMYVYILSPLAAFCVNQLTPRSVAPNTITLVGLVLMITAYATIWYYVPTLEISPQQEDNIPRWIFFWNGAAMLLYQTLDNMDGKQARRTKSSSPLGLLFDHGADAINPIFGSVNWIIAMMLNPAHDTWLCFSVVFGPYALFYTATWEEYYTGELIMPIVNGPSEGLFGGAVLSFISAWYGPSLWQQTTLWDAYLLPTAQQYLPQFFSQWLPLHLRHADILLLIASYVMIGEPLSKIIFVAKTHGSSTLYNLLPFATLISCFLAVGCMDLDIWLSMPRTSLHLCAALFVDMTVELQLRHLTNQKYNFKRWILIPLVGFTLFVCFGGIRSSRLTDDVLLVYASAAMGYLALKFAVVIHEVSTILNIWCFDITTPRKAGADYAKKQA